MTRAPPAAPTRCTITISVSSLVSPAPGIHRRPLARSHARTHAHTTARTHARSRDRSHARTTARPLARSSLPRPVDRPPPSHSASQHSSSSNVRTTASPHVVARDRLEIAIESRSTDRSTRLDRSIDRSMRAGRSIDRVESMSQTSRAPRVTRRPMGARTRATRRRGGSASTSESTSDGGGDAVDANAGCRTPERVAPSADDVRARETLTIAIFPRVLPETRVRGARACAGGARARARTRAIGEGWERNYSCVLTMSRVERTGHRASRVAGILQLLRVQSEPDRDDDARARRRRRRARGRGRGCGGRTRERGGI